MRSRRSGPDGEDDFRRAVADVQPLPPVRRTLRGPPPPAPLPRQTRRDEQAALRESLHGPLSADEAMETGEELVFLRDGLSREVLRKLRRGHWVVEDSLDLHGMNRIEASHAVGEFVRRCYLRRARCLRIVHGKGLGSRNREPVLKGKLRHWLAPRDEVLAFCQAPASQGGGGAVLVLLRGS
ncbi:MAG: Smr/MutS family protein [Clostridia bacterium]